MDTSYTLAKYVVNTRYEDLPPDVVEVSKRSILDTIGVILAASTLGEQGVKETIELVKDGGGKDESTIIGFGGKVTSWVAAFANGIMGHQLDYDDTHDAGLVHPGAATLPAAFAIAEKRGNVSGKELIAAFTLGCDVICRLTLPLTRSPSDYQWLHPAVFGKFGAVSAAGKLVGLDERQMVNAFGLALHQANVSMECTYSTGSFMRAIRDGFTAKAGVLSALLAQRGIEGDKNSLDGKFGLYNNCYRGDSDPAKVTADLGKRFEWANVSFKPWPCCRNTHSFIGATLSLVKEHDVKPEDVEEITVVSGGLAEGLIKEGSDERRRADMCSIDAKFSLPFVLGVAVARGGVVLEDFTTKGINNPTALGLAQKVKYRFDKKFDSPGIQMGIVEIKTKNNANYSKETTFPYGHPKNPIAKEDLVMKFRDCANYSVTPLSRERIDKIIQMVDNLEEVDDVSEVIQLLA